MDWILSIRLRCVERADVAYVTSTLSTHLKSNLRMDRALIPFHREGRHQSLQIFQGSGLPQYLGAALDAELGVSFMAHLYHKPRQHTNSRAIEKLKTTQIHRQVFLAFRGIHQKSIDGSIIRNAGQFEETLKKNGGTGGIVPNPKVIALKDLVHRCK